MKPDWEDLGELYGATKKALIGDVDCTADGNKPLCDRFGVEGYPTLKYVNPPDTELSVYEGGRSAKELRKFAKSLGPACTRDTLETNCKPKQRAALEPYLAMRQEEVLTQIAKVTAEVDDAHKAHKEMEREMSERMEASQQARRAAPRRATARPPPARRATHRAARLAARSDSMRSRRRGSPCSGC